MSNETKRDVFEGLLEQYKDTDDELIAERNPIDWAPQQSKQAYKIFLFKNRYNAALPDDLPVIPKVVGEILQSAYGKNNLYGVLDTARNGYKVSEPLVWIIVNQNTFATAWVLGVWRVEETGEIVKLEAEK